MSILDTMGGALAGAGDSLFGAGTSDALMSAGGTALDLLGGAGEGAVTGMLTGGIGGALGGAFDGLFGGRSSDAGGAAPAAPMTSAGEDAHALKIAMMARGQGDLDAQLLGGGLGALGGAAGALGSGAGLKWGASSPASSAAR